MKLWTGLITWVFLNSAAGEILEIICNKEKSNELFAPTLLPNLGNDRYLKSISSVCDSPSICNTYTSIHVVGVPGQGITEIRAECEQTQKVKIALFVDDGTIENSYQCPSDTFIQEILTENNGVNGALSAIGVICSLNPSKEVMTNHFTKQNAAWMRFDMTDDIPPLPLILVSPEDTPEVSTPPFRPDIAILPRPPIVGDDYKSSSSEEDEEDGEEKDDDDYDQDEENNEESEQGPNQDHAEPPYRGRYGHDRHEHGHGHGHRHGHGYGCHSHRHGGYRYRQWGEDETDGDHYHTGHRGRWMKCFFRRVAIHAFFAGFAGTFAAVIVIAIIAKHMHRRCHRGGGCGGNGGGEGSQHCRIFQWRQHCESSASYPPAYQKLSTHDQESGIISQKQSTDESSKTLNQV